MAKKAKTISKPAPNANYDYKQYAPEKPMGHGSFANLPVEPMYMTLSGKWNMRDAIPNSPVTTVDLISKVDENMSEK